jgi:hypothetical protein
VAGRWHRAVPLQAAARAGGRTSKINSRLCAFKHHHIRVRDPHRRGWDTLVFFRGYDSQANDPHGRARRRRGGCPLTRMLRQPDPTSSGREDDPRNASEGGSKSGGCSVQRRGGGQRGALQSVVTGNLEPRCNCTQNMFPISRAKILAGAEE